ncbi:hypothetical protein NCC49_005551 [Naganishia albida]|nr:hypothetical protein NCC49_005551 [Naganishia albida]
MAKKSKVSTSAAAAPVPQETVDARADIDDIFAKPSASTSQPSTITAKQAEPPVVVGKSKKKKKSKAPSATEPATEEQEPSPPSATTKSKKRKSIEVAAQSEPSRPSTTMDEAPEVAVFSDPSAAPSKKQRREASGNSGKTREQLVKDDEDERAFRDSRGDGPRRKTEEGFFIFKEAELGIRPESGDTPLCPFDCECCF